MIRFLSMVIIISGTWGILFGAGPKVCPIKQKGGFPLDSLRIVQQIDGWHEGKDGYIPFGHEKLFELINGGAPEYIDNGLIKGFLQRLTGPNGGAVEIFVEDFGTSAKASGMLAVKKQSIDSMRSLPDFDTGTVVIVPAIGALVVYGAIGCCYFEATLTGSIGEKTATNEMQRLFLFYRKMMDAGQLRTTRGK